MLDKNNSLNSYWPSIKTTKRNRKKIKPVDPPTPKTSRKPSRRKEKFIKGIRRKKLRVNAKFP